MKLFKILAVEFKTPFAEAWYGQEVAASATDPQLTHQDLKHLTIYHAQRGNFKKYMRKKRETHNLSTTSQHLRYIGNT